MGIIGKLLGRSTEPAEPLNYRCNTCQSRFETTETDEALITCGGCGSDDVERVMDTA